MRRILLILPAVLLLSTPLLIAQRQDLSESRWKVGEVERTALVHRPDLQAEETAPLIFVWHGHGGSAKRTARKLDLHRLWPEAIVVYPQGLKTPSYYDSEGKRSGWATTTDPKSNRDLAFFDAMLKSFREKGIVDERRIHSTGHSNGGGFTYVLLFERGEIFASIAPSSAGAGRKYRGRKPVHIPVFHLAGKTDTVVPMRWQQPVINALQRHNECADGTIWRQHPQCTIYPSKLNAPLVTYIHPGGHRMPQDAGSLFVKFFQEHPRPAK